jgi:hypothetical protein
MQGWSMAKWLAVLAMLFGAAVCLGNDLNPVKFKTAPTHDPVRLIGQDRAQAKIVVMTPKAAISGPLAFAVQDLQKFIKLATGAELAIQYGGPVDGPAIVIGDCEAAAKEGLVGSSFPPEGFAIKTAPQTVFIVGRDEAKVVDALEKNMYGTAWGIYEFLERFADVRWYFPGEIGCSVPKRTELVIQPVWIQDAPVFRKHEIWPGQPYVPAAVQTQHVRLRSGDSWPIGLEVHHPQDLSAEYGKTRPEIFQLNADGSRNFQMLCFGNPKTRETFLENIARHYDEGKPIFDAHGGLPDSAFGLVGNTITVSPNDMPVECTCEYCKKLWNPNGDPYGKASRIVAQFVADLARDVEKRWPDKVILYLAYWNYTTPPEGITFPKNVQVELCGMPGVAQFKEPVIADREQRNIDEWMKISNGHKVQTWEYSCWPEDQTKAMYFFPHTIKEFYQHNRDKIVGSFINGVGDHWPRQQISLYAWMKVLWNPDFDVDAAISEYCRRMYGPASDEMLQLVKMQCDGWEKSRWPSGTLNQKAIYEISYPRQDVLKMEALFAQAREKAKGDELIMKRLDYYAGPLQEFFNESKGFGGGK